MPKEVDVIIVYRSEQGNLTDLVEHLKKLINTEVNTVVTGDFNICYISNRNNKKMRKNLTTVALCIKLRKAKQITTMENLHQGRTGTSVPQHLFH